MKLAALLFLGMTAMAQAEDAHRPLVGRSLVTTRYGIVASVAAARGARRHADPGARRQCRRRRDRDERGHRA